MASPFQIGSQTTLRSVSNPTGSWAVLLNHFMVQRSMSRFP